MKIMKILLIALFLFVGYSGISQSQLFFTIPDCTSSGVNDISSSDVLIYPNPGNGYFHLSTGDILGTLKVTIHSSNGMQIAEFKNVSGNLDLDLSQACSGVYFVRIESSANVKIERITIY